MPRHVYKAKTSATFLDDLAFDAKTNTVFSKVTLVYTSPKSTELVHALASSIKALNNGSSALIAQADLSQTSIPEQIIEATLAEFGPNIDILVNNAGVMFAKPITETTPEDYATIFNLNVRAPLLMTKAVVPHLRAPGRIINMSSVGSRFGPPQLAMYGASKAALEGMTRCLAQELGGEGHTVNAVAPGPTESEMLDGVPKEIVETQLKTTAVQHRVGTVEDVARIVAWLAGPDAAWVSGQTVSASGGFLML
jgi:3-oxoacyl-[acyl-carrier protein] reductase